MIFIKLYPSLFFVIIVFAFANCKQTKQRDQINTISAGKMPALAADKNSIYVVFGSGDSILYVHSADEGKTFSAPELIDTLTDLVAGATRGPQIAITTNGVAVIAVNKSGNIYSFSRQTGNKWTRTKRINDEPDVDKEGFSGLSSNGNHLFAIWTDLRNDKHNKIFGAQSNDGGQTWSKNSLVYASPESTICECCKPSVAMNGNNVYVMFRNWLHGNRDLYVIQSDDGGNSFGKAEKLGNGSWKLDGCPMDGGGLDVNEKTGVQTVWRRENKIYAAQLNKSEIEIGEGKGCSIATVNNKNIYAWTNENGEVICRLPDGKNKIIGKGSLPLLKPVSNDAIVCVWQDDNLIRSSVIRL